MHNILHGLLQSYRLLYIQEKPGSGKCTLTKYFRENLGKRERNAKSAIVADFFYSDREGRLQTSHYSMRQSVLYGVLEQRASFFSTNNESIGITGQNVSISLVSAHNGLMTL
jgi:hypothetical protein